MKALGSQSSQSHLSSLPCACQAPGTTLWGEAETEAPALEHLQRRRRAEEEHGTPQRRAPQRAQPHQNPQGDNTDGCPGDRITSQPRTLIFQSTLGACPVTRITSSPFYISSQSVCSWLSPPALQEDTPPHVEVPLLPAASPKPAFSPPAPPTGRQGAVLSTRIPARLCHMSLHSSFKTTPAPQGSTCGLGGGGGGRPPAGGI